MDLGWGTYVVQSRDLEELKQRNAPQFNEASPAKIETRKQLRKVLYNLLLGVDYVDLIWKVFQF